MKNKLMQFDLVRYCGPAQPFEKLFPGDIGAILENYGDGYYEVQFDDEDLSAKVIRAFPGDQPEKVKIPL